MIRRASFWRRSSSQTLRGFAHCRAGIPVWPRRPTAAAIVHRIVVLNASMDLLMSLPHSRNLSSPA
jgi:hypothetical protein